MGGSLKGMENLSRKLRALKNFDQQLEKPMGDIGAQIRDEARRNLGRNGSNNTGELRKYMDFEVKNDHGHLVTVVFNPLEYALYVEVGTGPRGQADHAGISPEVTPRYRVDGWWVSTDDFPTFRDYGYTPINIQGKEYIFSTGQPAQPFLFPAFRDNYDTAVKYLTQAINRLIKEVARG